MNKRRLILLVLFVIAAVAAVFVGVILITYFTICCGNVSNKPLVSVSTIAGTKGEFGEPFGVAVRDGETYVSDGEKGIVWRIGPDNSPVEFATGLHTPSAIAFDNNGDLIVADTGSHTVKRIDSNGAVSVVAGFEGQFGDIDGDALSARLNAPVGIAIREDGSIIVADTYNDKIKVISNGFVTTLAGSARGFADGLGANAMFDTPCSIAPWRDGRVVVADTLNSRIRVIEPDGRTWTLAGTDEADITDGPLLSSQFIGPASIAVSGHGELFIADGSTVRAIRNRTFPIVETLTQPGRGFVDGARAVSKFNRISGMAFDQGGALIISDSDNAAVRYLSSQEISKHVPQNLEQTKRTDPLEFRNQQPARWPYEPADAKRDIAGTLGEIRGEFTDEESRVRFHNGLDIAGGYGERAYFIREEKVLDPAAAENFGTSRELLRLPALGYIHLRLGRDASDKSFGDARFLFDSDMKDVRIRRGTQFKAGDLLGTLNSMNHVHLIAGRSGDELNALDALILPGVSDRIPPVIENVSVYDENWRPIETEIAAARIKLTGRIRVVVNAYDRMDGNPERRRLGVYRLGYQILRKDLAPVADINWNINFDRNPDPAAVKFAYSQGSKSGSTGETIFRYIVTNKVNGNSFSEGFLDVGGSPPGEYILRAFAADYFGNTFYKDISIEVTQ